MAPLKKEPTIAALEAVHSALKPLDAADRQRVLSSLYALLEIPNTDVVGQRSQLPGTGGQATGSAGAQTLATGRRMGITELIQQKHPGTHPEFITLFAYYREKHENVPHFSRADLEKYYAPSHQAPPKNYIRDFNNAVKWGWIHEDGENSFITSRGIEMVESGFAGTEKRAKKKSAKPSKRGKKSAKKASR